MRPNLNFVPTQIPHTKRYMIVRGSTIQHQNMRTLCEEDIESPQVTTTWEVNKDRLANLHLKISEPPRLLSEAAGRSSCCIFRAPQGLIDINGESYQPHIVSIGPYHAGRPHLRMIEEHKWRYLRSLLNRTRPKGLSLEHYLVAVQPLESRARECYSEAIALTTDEFVELLVLDGFFIIELFRRIGGVVPVEPEDPLISTSWIVPFFYRDFLRLENQIPYFVLECLFHLSFMPGEESGPTLGKLVLGFFNNAMQRPDSTIQKYHNIKGMHLLDMVRSSFVSPEKQNSPRGTTPSHIIHCVSKLRRAGIKIRQADSDSFLVIKFRSGVIHMPTVTIDDFMSAFLVNCVAFEQCHNGCSKHVTTYATFLDCLVNTHKDVEYLCDHNIVENYFGTDAEVARLVNCLGKDVAFDIDACYLSELFNDVHEYYKSSWHVQWASFKYTYFDTPWSFVSALAALVLLVLTVVQTFYTVYPYLGPHHQI